VGGAGGAMADDTHQITVVDHHGQPVADVPIVVNDAEGAIVSTAKTDASGSADATIPDGGSVSAFWTYGLNFYIDAIHAPPPGAPITFGIFVAEREPPPVDAPTTYSIYPYYPAGTKSLSLSTNCASANTYPDSKYPQIDNESCTDDDTQDFIFTAHDASYNLIGWATWLDAPTNPGGIVDTSVSVTQTDTINVDMALTDLPSQVTRATVTVFMTFHNAHYQQSANAIPPSSSTHEAAFQLPALGGAQYAWSFFASVGDYSTAGAELHHHASSSQPPATASLSADSFTWLSANALDLSDPEHPIATWTSSKTPTADYTNVQMSWGGGTSYVLVDALLPPHSATKMRLPDIPDELSSYRPVAANTFYGTTVACVENTEVDGYADWIDGGQTAPFGDATTAYAWSNE
jgi:hypothetical protein